MGAPLEDVGIVALDGTGGVGAEPKLGWKPPPFGGSGAGAPDGGPPIGVGAAARDGTGGVDAAPKLGWKPLLGGSGAGAPDGGPPMGGCAAALDGTGGAGAEPKLGWNPPDFGRSEDGVMLNLRCNPPGLDGSGAGAAPNFC